MSDGDIKVVGLSSPKSKGKLNWKVISAVIGIVVLSLGIIAGILLVRQQQDLREKADIISCTDPTVEQCPVAGSPNILRNCHPPESDNSPVETLCNEEGKVAFCGNKNYCCPSVNGSWTTDMSVCNVDLLSKIDLIPAVAELNCTQGFADDFASIDLNRWNKEGDVEVQAGVLNVKRDEAGTGTSYDGLYTKDSLSGDFVVEVDIPEVVKSGNGGGGATFLFTTDNTDGLSVSRAVNNQGVWRIGARLNVGTTFDDQKKDLTQGPVSFKVERKSGKFKVYYKTGASYILLLDSTKVLTKVIKQIHLSALNTEFTAAEYTIAKYDNFKISCAGGGPTATATSTSTSNPTVTATATATATATGIKTATPTATSTGVKTATPTVTPTSTGSRTATPTVTATGTGLRTSTPTSTSTSTRTPTPRSTATATSSSAPIPVTGANWPTIIGTGFGILMILASFILAF